MLQFPDNFFESEYREDFLVDSTMKTVWAAELEVLSGIASICEKYQLPWYADWGTLLGAVRHKGFVPWDDDIDICMKRSDYQKLLKVLPKELPPKWKVYNAEIGNTQQQFWTCVANDSMLLADTERLQAFHGCPFVVGIDIFPLDVLPRNEEERELVRNLMDLIVSTVRLAKREDKTPEYIDEKEHAVCAIEDFCKVKIDRKKNLVTELWSLANKICMSYQEDEGDYFVQFTEWLENEEKKFKKEWYDDVEYMQFESVYMPVPLHYDDILKTLYGNYMVFQKNIASHDYPFYNKQLKQMRKFVKEMEEKAAHTFVISSFD